MSEHGGYLRASERRADRDQLVDHGLATDAEIDRHLAAVTGGTLDLATSPMITAWGRRVTDEAPRRQA